MITWLIVMPVPAAVLGAVRLLRRRRTGQAFRWLLATNLALLGGACVLLATALTVPAQAAASTDPRSSGPPSRCPEPRSGPPSRSPTRARLRWPR